MLRGRLHHGAANALGLKEGPEIRGFDVLADGFGLRPLAQGLGQRQKQRDHRDQQGDLLVGAGGMLGVLGMLHAFVGAHDGLLGGSVRSVRTIDRTACCTQEASVI